jgi:hypothetical protein
MESQATITEWDPPRRFVAETTDEGPDTAATEWTVEARTGGACVVRVVHSWFASSDEWDDQFEGHTFGWLSFFRILRLYLAHFRGQPCSAFQVMGVAPEPLADAWEAFSRPLGLAGAVAGQRVSAPDGAPPLGGVVEQSGPPEGIELLLRLDAPAPGVAHLFPMAMDGRVYLSVRYFLYGEPAAPAAERAEQHWLTWMNEHFSMAGDASAVAAE